MSIDHHNLAQRLREAYHDGPVAPLRDGLSPDDADGAYAVQSINTHYWMSEGRRIIGRKIGLTSESVQKQLSVAQPDYGVLFQDRLIENGGMLDLRSVLQPKVEAEIALVLGKSLDQLNTTMVDVMGATEYVLPALEIVDSRITDWQITLADTIADNASSAFFVLGSEPRALADLDLRTCGMVTEINGRVASVGAGAACLGHPLNAAAWLARTLTMQGEPLRAGDIILTGALGPMSTLLPGMQVRASIGGVGSVSLVVSAAPDR